MAREHNDHSEVLPMSLPRSSRRLGWLVVGLVGLAVTGYLIARRVTERVLRPWEQAWLATPEESARVLSGDELVMAPTIDETRAITIDAAPAAIWPWLVQMGYGKAGWYSYDRMDMHGGSANAIEPAWQNLAVGDPVPTHPTGGFKVAVIEPERTLVLYMDREMVRPATAASEDVTESTPVGLTAAGKLGSRAMAEFRGTWTFRLEPIGERQTRLLERFRLALPDQPGSVVARSAMGFGMFLMTRKQMLGLKARAELGATDGGALAGGAEPTPA